MAKEHIDLSDLDKAMPYVAELAGQSDRACGIVAGSLLEALLEQILRNTFVEGKADDLFPTYGPLSSFAAKINAAAALGLITEGEQRELHTVRRIRNDFAHGLERTSFSSPPILRHVAQLRLSRSRLTGKDTPARTDFQAAVMVLLGFLLDRSEKAVRIATPNDHVQHLIDSSPLSDRRLTNEPG